MAIVAPSPTTAPTRHRHRRTSLRSLQVMRSSCLPSSSPYSTAAAAAGGAVSPAQTVTTSVTVRHLDKRLGGKPSVFFLDVSPLCFHGSRPSMTSFAHWLRLFFSKISHHNPVIAVLDGEGGNEYRRRLLPSYKAHRRKCSSSAASVGWLTQVEPQIVQILQNCNVPVVKVKGYEADDVVATLTNQALDNSFQVMIGSPDKDFKQLISNNVRMIMPVPELRRWCIYNLKHYIRQYGCNPASDLSLRCFMGDDVDGVPGIQKVVPSFGRKTAVKLLKKHGSLENLLNAAAVRTVGRDYAQNALTKYADYLRRNYQVLSLRRDASIELEEKWLCKRDSSNDSLVLSEFVDRLTKGKDAVCRSRHRVTSTA